MPTSTTSTTTTTTTTTTNSEIAQDFKTDLRFQSTAILALQEVRA
jgi:hypothetical protein